MPVHVNVGAVPFQPDEGRGPIPGVVPAVDVMVVTETAAVVEETAAPEPDIDEAVMRELNIDELVELDIDVELEVRLAEDVELKKGGLGWTGGTPGDVGVIVGVDERLVGGDVAELIKGTVDD